MVPDRGSAAAESCRAGQRSADGFVLAAGDGRPGYVGELADWDGDWQPDEDQVWSVQCACLLTVRRAVSDETGVTAMYPERASLTPLML
jgi:hypothetical protein